MREVGGVNCGIYIVRTLMQLWIKMEGYEMSATAQPDSLRASALLDRRYFNLPEDQFRRFTAMLDKPPANNPRLSRLLRSKAPWDK